MARKTVVRHKDIIIAAALAVLNVTVVVLVQILVIMPPRALMRAQGRDLTQNVKQLEDSTRKERELKAVVSDNAQLRTRLVEFDRRIPAKSEIAALLAEILRSADRTDLKILQTQPKEPALIGQGLQRFPYELELLGQYHAVGQFLNSIETHQSFMQVAKIDFSGSTDGTVRAKVLLHLYSTVNEAPAKDDGGANPGKDKPETTTTTPPAAGAKADDGKPETATQPPLTAGAKPDKDKAETEPAAATSVPARAKTS